MESPALPKTRRFAILEPIGAGGSGRVFLARDLYAGGGPVALKLLPREETERVALDEFLALRELSHPGLVRVFERGVVADTGERFFTSEYLKGRDFASAAGADAGNLLPLTAETLRALDAIHRRRYVHCDLKPGNLLVTTAGAVKVLDFGLAVREGTVLPEGRVRGTLPYVAPESVAGRPVDRRADLYSLGVVLFQSLTGDLPPRGPDLLPEFPAAALSAVPEPFRSFLPRLLARDPAERLPSAARALAVLAELAGRDLPLETPETRRALLSGGGFVGRRKELEALELELRRAVLDGGTADRRAVLVKGEAGIGKGRLLREFKDSCQRRGVDFFLAPCVQGEQPAYAAVEQAFRGLLARVGPESARARRAARDLSRILPELSPEGDSGPARDLSDPEEALRWHEAVAKFVESAVHGGSGFVLAFSDAHDATREVQELLAYLLRYFPLADEPGAPVLVVLSLNDEAEPPGGLRDALSDLSREGRLLVLSLPRLDEEGVREFVESVAAMPDPPKRLVRLLLERTGGNPFFLEQWLRMLLEEGTIEWQEDRWRVHDLERTGVPAGLKDLLVRRLHGLSSRESEVLEFVAAYGEPVPREVLDRVVAGGATIATELVSRTILTEVEGASAFAFRHGLLGRLILERGDPRRRQERHSTIARALSVPGGPAAGAEKLAHHHSLGIDRGLAVRYALAAARRAEREGLADRAAIFYSRTLARLDVADPRRPELLHALGDAHVRSGRTVSAVRAWREAADESREPFFQAVLHRKIAEALEKAGSYEAALLNARRGLDLTPSDDPRGRVPLLRLLGAIHRRRAEHSEAIAAIREGLRLAHGERSEETVALLNLLADVTMQMGDRRQALNFYLRSLRLSRSLQFVSGEAASLHNLGTLMSAWGDAGRALSYYQESLRLHESGSNLAAVAMTFCNVANIFAERGDFDSADEYFRRSLSVRRRIGDPLGVAMVFGNVGSMHRVRGWFGLALAYYERAVRHFQRIGSDHGAAFFRVSLADLLLSIGAFDPAREHTEVAMAAAARNGFRRIEAHCCLLSARRERLTGNLGAAEERAKAALALDGRIGHREGAAEDLLELARIQTAGGDAESASEVVRQALFLARRARSRALEMGCRQVRGGLSMLRGQRGRADLDACINFARRAHRPEALGDGLALRARLYLAEGSPRRAVLDAREAVQLSERIAGFLPTDLAGIYRRDARRVKLRDLLAEVEAAVAREGKPGADGGGSKERGMKPETSARLLEINKELNSETDLRRLLNLIMDTAVELTGAERGFLILVDEKRITFQVARNFRRKELEGPELQVSQSIVRQVMATGEPVLTDNATLDPRFKKFQSVDDLKLTSILSVPFQCRGRKLGAIYLDNRAREGVFSEEDVEMVKALSDQAAIAIWNLRSRDELSRELRDRSDELHRVRQAIGDRPYKYEYGEIVGSSARMREVFLLLDKIIDTEVPVLIQGESGTGKELVARAIHYKGPRRSGPFVTVNCGAVPDTLLESEFFGYVRGAFTGADSDKTGFFVQADHGTLFLDEIGDMDFDMQKKLLRVLQQGEVRPVGAKRTVRVDVRIVCATNKDLRQRMLEGKFREDLYYRINVISIVVPPLRDRREDIAPLVEFFVRRAAPEMGLPQKPIEQEAMALLTAYSWPGNVRELENEVKKALALSGDLVTADDLSPHIQGPRAGQEPELVPAKGSLKETMEATERSIIVRALDETGGNQTQAAKKLGISRVWLRKKMEKYDLLG